MIHYKCDKCGKELPISQFYVKFNTRLCEKCYGHKINRIDNKEYSKEDKIAKNIKNKSLYGVHGWLDLFIMTLTLLIGSNIYYCFIDMSDIINSGLPLIYTISLSWYSILSYSAFIGMIIYTIISIYQSKSNAISLVKKVLIILLVVYGIDYFLQIKSSGFTNFNMGFERLIGVVIISIWQNYFKESERIKNTFPESKRKTYLIDNILFYSLLSLQAIYFILMYFLL
jgi:hypothetical protein